MGNVNSFRKRALIPRDLEDAVGICISTLKLADKLKSLIFDARLDCWISNNRRKSLCKNEIFLTINLSMVARTSSIHFDHLHKRKDSPEANSSTLFEYFVLNFNCFLLQRNTSKKGGERNTKNQQERGRI